MLRYTLGLFVLLVVQLLNTSDGYSALEDARVIAEYRRQLKYHNRPTNHAEVARRLVHQADWAAVGSLSTDPKVMGFPMVNMISVADSTKDGKSKGIIYFLLTDLDFTGRDWKHSNKVTFFFSDEQLRNCSKQGVDPMEPTCARALLSGQVQPINNSDAEYEAASTAFLSRHPQAINWLRAHTFYLCKLNIEHIYVLDWYGGPHDVPVELYYETDP